MGNSGRMKRLTELPRCPVCGPDKPTVITLGICPAEAWCFRSKGEVQAKVQELNRC